MKTETAIKIAEDFYAARQRVLKGAADLTYANSYLLFGAALHSVIDNACYGSFGGGDPRRIPGEAKRRKTCDFVAMCGMYAEMTDAARENMYDGYIVKDDHEALIYFALIDAIYWLEDYGNGSTDFEFDMIRALHNGVIPAFSYLSPMLWWTAVFKVASQKIRQGDVTVFETY